MTDVERIARDILTREGGFVDDPDDPGGATNHGVTIGTLRRLGMDVDGDGRIDTQDVRALTRDQAVEIFVRHYYHRPRISLLPEAVQASVFDMYVNSGAMAVRLLQRLVADMGWPLADDGVIGPRTAAAVRDAWQAAPDHLADAYGIARRNYYYALGDSRPRLRKFARRRDGGKGGWITRAEEFISPKYHLSEAAHRERVAAWA